MIEGRDVIRAKREVLLEASPQPAMPSVITGVEDNMFWVSLPKEGNQVLVLQEGQKIKIGVSLSRGFYQSETTVLALGKNKDQFYGLAIPKEFSESQEGRFVRARHATNVLFKAGSLTAQTALVNFSAGGVMVYLVPQLTKILQSGHKITLTLNIDNLSFEQEVKLSWQKQYANIPFAGFEFVNISPQLQGVLAALSIKYTEGKL
ncbi:type IV pilus assembly PilZ [Desulfotomaculum nigrificans CO-1-SRB]|uniref:Type IV pilus assembly PilZ n=1 Tax=Desulfotomaculum nigrificans (strain DSM 14880 / VKM B-2319 / CO-1-SRB) TaxID=868595 RepID=F6B3R2_DESCC|nr:flagellar brake domain-containing protein [Desulfotomaculum nigrificans]AEF95221.1 type IV pilus assembly PilZ [Desulfotomaculum nigrificans CO-1-SRB]